MFIVIAPPSLSSEWIPEFVDFSIFNFLFNHRGQSEGTKDTENGVCMEPLRNEKKKSGKIDIQNSWRFLDCQNKTGTNWPCQIDESSFWCFCLLLHYRGSWCLPVIKNQHERFLHFGKTLFLYEEPLHTKIICFCYLGIGSISWPVYKWNAFVICIWVP